jgi:hypothetical protein
MATLVANKVAELMVQGWDENMYPREWMCFVLLGKPAGDRALQSYNSGLGTTHKRPFTLSDIRSGMRPQMSKQARHSTDNPHTPSSNDTITGEKPRVVKVEFSRSAVNADDQLIDRLEKHISILKELIARKVEVEKNELLIIEIYKQMSSLMTKYTATAGSSNGTNVLGFETPK